jgi:hypothetical protein
LQLIYHSLNEIHFPVIQTSCHFNRLDLWKKNEILESVQKFKFEICNNDNGTKINTKFLLMSPVSLCLSSTFIVLRKTIMLIKATAARLLGLRVRIPPRARMSVCCECCVLSGRGLYDGLITRPEESYRVWCV